MMKLYLFTILCHYGSSYATTCCVFQVFKIWKPHAFFLFIVTLSTALCSEYVRSTFKSPAMREMYCKGLSHCIRQRTYDAIFRLRAGSDGAVQTNGVVHRHRRRRPRAPLLAPTVIRHRSHSNGVHTRPSNQ